MILLAQNYAHMWLGIVHTHIFFLKSIFFGHTNSGKFWIFIADRVVVCIALWEEYSLADMRGFSHWRHFLEDFLLRSLAVRIEVPETEVEGSADNLTKVPRKKAMKNLRQSQHTCLFCKKGENFLLKLLASQAKLGSMLRFFFLWIFNFFMRYTINVNLLLLCRI